MCNNGVEKGVRGEGRGEKRPTARIHQPGSSISRVTILDFSVSTELRFWVLEKPLARVEAQTLVASRAQQWKQIPQLTGQTPQRPGPVLSDAIYRWLLWHFRVGKYKIRSDHEQFRLSGQAMGCRWQVRIG